MGIKDMIGELTKVINTTDNVKHRVMAQAYRYRLEERPYEGLEFKVITLLNEAQEHLV